MVSLNTAHSPFGTGSLVEMISSMVADHVMHRMDEFVYQAVVDPKFLSKDVRNVLQKEPIVLPLWDPMGALA